jgi:hypothetical protein
MLFQGLHFSGMMPTVTITIHNLISTASPVKNKYPSIEMGLAAFKLISRKLSANPISNLYRSAPVSTGNTFQDLTRLHETADKTERYIIRDIPITYINAVKFNW